MRVFVPTEAKFVHGADASTVCPCERTHTLEFWERYLDAFDDLILTGRIVHQSTGSLPPLDSSNIRFVAIPLDAGVYGFVTTLLRLNRILRENPDVAVCLRMPTVTSAIVGLFCLVRGRPFGVEVVGDPSRALKQEKGGTVKIEAARRFLTFAQRFLCRRAIATAYVTERVLQSEYPPDKRRFTTNFSSITLREDNFRFRRGDEVSSMTLINVGSMGKTLYKGQDILIRSMEVLLPEFKNIKLLLVGGGVGRAKLEKLVHEKGLADSVVFCGHVKDRGKLEALLDQSDLFVFPSRTEGLPKALIEAMARGLPAVGTRVGGIVELLPEESLCAAGDVNGLADLIRKNLLDGARLSACGTRNYEKAREFEVSRIMSRRRAYYLEVKKAALMCGGRRAWAANGGSSRFLRGVAGSKK